MKERGVQVEERRREKRDKQEVIQSVKEGRKRKRKGRDVRERRGK